MVEHISELIKNSSRGIYLGGTYLINSNRFYITVFSQEMEGELVHTVISIIDPLWNAKEKYAPEEVVEHARNNINQLMEEAADQICTHFTENTKTYIVEDSTGIHKLRADETTERIVFYTYGYHYQYIYEKVANPIIGSSKRYSATRFYSKMATEHDSISV